MIITKTLLYGTKRNHIPLRITIEYEWNDDNDELIEKIVKNLPNFIEMQAKES